MRLSSVCCSDPALASLCVRAHDSARCSHVNHVSVPDPLASVRHIHGKGPPDSASPVVSSVLGILAVLQQYSLLVKGETLHGSRLILQRVARLCMWSTLTYVGSAVGAS